MDSVFIDSAVYIQKRHTVMTLRLAKRVMRLASEVPPFPISAGLKIIYSEMDDEMISQTQHELSNPLST